MLHALLFARFRHIGGNRLSGKDISVMRHIKDWIYRGKYSGHNGDVNIGENEWTHREWTYRETNLGHIGNRTYRGSDITRTN